MRIITLGVCLACLLGLGGTAAKAQEGFRSSLGVSFTTSEETSYMAGLDTSQPAELVVTLGYYQPVSEFVAGYEISLRSGTKDLEAFVAQCAPEDCGDDDFVARPWRKSSYGASAGVVFGRSIGSTLLLATTGFEISDRAVGFTAGTEQVIVQVAEDGLRTGYYYGIRVEQPLTNKLFASVEWRRTHTQSREYRTLTSPFGSQTVSGTNRAETDTVSLQLGWRF